MVQLLGCASLGEVVGYQILKVAHPDHRGDWPYLQKRLWYHQLLSFTLETCLLRPDRSSLWYRVTSSRFPDGDQQLGGVRSTALDCQTGKRTIVF